MSGKTLDVIAARAIAVTLFIFPVLFLSVRNGVSLCLVVLVLVSLSRLFRTGIMEIQWDRGDLCFVVAMAAPFVATFCSLAYHQDLAPDTLDGPARFLLAIPGYLMLRGFPWSFPRMFEYGFPLGAITGFVTSVFFPFVYLPLPGTYFVDPPNFGGSMLILGFVSLSTIHWTRRDPPAIVLLKLSGFAIGLVCAVRSGERGIWIAIPVLLLLWSLRRLSLKLCAAVAVAAFVVAIAAYGYFPTIQARVAQTGHEVSDILDGNLDTSIGRRLQIWRAAADIIRVNPVFGIGPANIAEELKAYKGWSSSLGLQAGLAQIHNEMLGYTLRVGLLGLLAILAVYAVPFALFLKAAASDDRIKNSAAMMGMLVVAAYFTFGLSFEVFVLKMFATFYAMTVATLLAIARNSQRPLYAGLAITQWSRAPRQRRVGNA